MKIKGNKKDMEKTEKLFECGRALDCKKTLFSSSDLHVSGLCGWRVRSDLSIQDYSHLPVYRSVLARSWGRSWSFKVL